MKMQFLANYMEIMFWGTFENGSESASFKKRFHFDLHVNCKTELFENDDIMRIMCVLCILWALTAWLCINVSLAKCGFTAPDTLLGYSGLLTRTWSTKGI